MKVLHLVDWYRPVGGAERLTFDVLQALEEDGHACVVAMDARPHQLATGKRVEVEIPDLEMRFEKFRIRDHWAVRRCRQRIDALIAEQRPDVCHIHACQNPYVVEHLTRRLPCVRNVHDVRLLCFTQRRILPDGETLCDLPMGRACLDQGCLSRTRARTPHQELAPWTMRNLEAHRKIPIFILECRAYIDLFERNGFREEQIAWLPNFTSMQPRIEVEALADRLRSPGERRVLALGRAWPEKGFHVLLDAVRHLRTPGVSIRLLTDGPLRAELEQRAARDPSLCRSVHIEGMRPYEQMPAIYAASDLVVVPSVGMENFPLVGIEAMASMRPVVASRTGGIVDWLVDGETGFLFEMGSGRDLARKIDLVFADEKRARAMGRAGYERVAAHYNRDLYVERLVRAYERSRAIWSRRR